MLTNMDKAIPSDSVREDRKRLLDMIGADTVEDALSLLRNHGEQRRQMCMEIKALRRMDDDNQDAIGRQEEQLVVLNRRVMDAEDDAAAVREDFAALVDVYVREVRKC